MPLADEIWPPVALSLVLAALTTLLLLPIGAAIGWWLARTRSVLKAPVSAMVSLPLVLPPTVLGFYLLIAMGPHGPGGALASLWGARTLAFSFEGLVVGSIIYSMPFMVHPIRLAFEAIDEDTFEVAATLGAATRQIILRVALPLARSGFVTGAIMAFAQTIGEFGVVLMIGGNIPGETKVLSIAIYDSIERGEWAEAHMIAAGMVVFAFIVVASVMAVDKSHRRRNDRETFV